MNWPSPCNATRRSTPATAAAPKPADHELWRHLDRLTVPTGPGQDPTTLRTMLSIYWTDMHPVADDPEYRPRAEHITHSAPAAPSTAHCCVPQARRVHDREDRAT